MFVDGNPLSQTPQPPRHGTGQPRNEAPQSSSATTQPGREKLRIRKREKVRSKVPVWACCQRGRSKRAKVRGTRGLRVLGPDVRERN